MPRSWIPRDNGKYAVTVQTILRFPDHHLRATAQRIVVFDEDLCSLATDRLDTLRAASAIGITATHIGVLKRARDQSGKTKLARATTRAKRPTKQPVDLI